MSALAKHACYGAPCIDPFDHTLAKYIRYYVS